MNSIENFELPVGSNNIDFDLGSFDIDLDALASLTQSGSAEEEAVLRDISNEEPVQNKVKPAKRSRGAATESNGRVASARQSQPRKYKRNAGNQRAPPGIPGIDFPTSSSAVVVTENVVPVDAHNKVGEPGRNKAQPKKGNNSQRGKAGVVKGTQLQYRKMRAVSNKCTPPVAADIPERVAVEGVAQHASHDTNQYPQEELPLSTQSSVTVRASVPAEDGTPSPVSTADLPSPTVNIPFNSTDRLVIVEHTLATLAFDFHAKDLSSKLKEQVVLPKQRTHMKFFTSNQIIISPMIVFLIQQGVLHRLILLDHVARRVDRALVAAGVKSVMSKYDNKLKILNGALCTYLNEYYTGKLILLHHHLSTTQSQEAMIKEVMDQVQTDLLAAWVSHGNSDPNIIFHTAKSPTGQWIATIRQLLLIEAQRRDVELSTDGMSAPGRLLVLSEHLTVPKLMFTTHAQFLNMMGLRQVNEIAALEVAARYGANPVPLSTNIVVCTATPTTDNAATSATDLQPAASSDVAYWAKIDPQYIVAGQTREWCAPGKVIGIYPSGAGPPSIDALFMCVVTSQPSQLELPAPFGGAETAPVNLYLEDAVAIGVQGRVPVLMEPEVLRRFANPANRDRSRELFWTDQGRVDFADETNAINYDTAQYIGFADFDKRCFDASGALIRDFHDVCAVHVMVSYRAVSMTQINARFDATNHEIKSLRTHTVTELKKVNVKVDLLSLYGRRLAVGMTLWVLMLAWLLKTYIDNTHRLPCFPDHYTPELPVPLTPTPLPPPPPRSTALTFANDFKPGTTIISSMRRVPTSYFHRRGLRRKGVETLQRLHRTAHPHASANTTAIVVAYARATWTRPLTLRAAGGMGKSTEAQGLVQEPEIYGMFPGGVYFIDCSYNSGEEVTLLQKLAEQMFCALDGTGCGVWDMPVDDLVNKLGRLVAAQKKHVLVLLDNVAKPSIVKRVADVVRENGAIAVTTRKRVLLPDSEVIELRELHGPNLYAFLDTHGVHVNASNNASIQAVLEHVGGVPLSLSLVCKLHTLVEMPWPDIRIRIKEFDGNVGLDGLGDPESFDVDSEMHMSTFACIAVSMDALNEHMRQNLVAMLLLPRGALVPLSVVAGMWEVSTARARADLFVLDDQALVLYDKTQHAVHLHDMVRQYLEATVRRNASDQMFMLAPLASLASHVLSPVAISTLITIDSFAAPVNLKSYFRHWEHLNRTCPDNMCLYHHTPNSIIHEHAQRLHECCTRTRKHCEYAGDAIQAQYALKIKATEIEYDWLENVLIGMPAISPIAEFSLEEQGLRVCYARVIREYAAHRMFPSVVAKNAEENLAPYLKHSLTLALTAVEASKHWVGNSSVEYVLSTLTATNAIRRLTAIGGGVDSNRAALHNRTLINLALRFYAVAPTILQRLSVYDFARVFYTGIENEEVALYYFHRTLAQAHIGHANLKGLLIDYTNSDEADEVTSLINKAQNPFAEMHSAYDYIWDEVLNYFDDPIPDVLDISWLKTLRTSRRRARN